jgi:DTW domain-containing protein YfiP
VGHDYTGNRELDRVLSDSGRHCLMLYPGRFSRNLTDMSREERSALEIPGKKLTLLVIDGTWSTARKMVHLSRNLKTVPRICFTPPAPSNFRVRQQPRKECYSTIEAIHHTLDLFGRRGHDGLLEVFDKMVDRQIELAHCGKPSRRKYY